VSNGLNETMRHQHGKRQKMQTFERLQQAFIVACRSSKSGQPGKTALDDPPTRQQDKAAFDIGVK
jgi:hypothetical protein